MNIFFVIKIVSFAKSAFTIILFFTQNMRIICKIIFSNFQNKEYLLKQFEKLKYTFLSKDLFRAVFFKVKILLPFIILSYALS